MHLKEDLAQTRKRGYSFDDEEHALGLRCLAACIFDEHREPFAAISISGPISRITDDRVTEFGAMVISIILLRTPEALRSKTLGLFATASYTVESVCVLAMAMCIHWAGLYITLCTVAAIFAILILVSLLGRQRKDFWTVVAAKNK